MMNWQYNHVDVNVLASNGFHSSLEREIIVNNYLIPIKNVLCIGAYCYTISRSPNLIIQRSYCHLRRCKSEQCRIAGTGNDYIGSMRTTRSNRTCASWRASEFTPNMVQRKFWNDSLFGDTTAEKAENFCRNPSRDISGYVIY